MARIRVIQRVRSTEIIRVNDPDEEEAADQAFIYTRESTGAGRNTCVRDFVVDVRPQRITRLAARAWVIYLVEEKPVFDIDGNKISDFTEHKAAPANLEQRVTFSGWPPVGYVV